MCLHHGLIHCFTIQGTSQPNFFPLQIQDVAIDQPREDMPLSQKLLGTYFTCILPHSLTDYNHWFSHSHSWHTSPKLEVYRFTSECFGICITACSQAYPIYLEVKWGPIFLAMDKGHVFLFAFRKALIQAKHTNILPWLGAPSLKALSFIKCFVHPGCNNSI